MNPYDRVFGRCITGNVDLALAMIEAGQAVVYARYLRKRDPLRARYSEEKPLPRKLGAEFGTGHSFRLMTGGTVVRGLSVNADGRGLRLCLPAPQKNGTETSLLLDRSYRGYRGYCSYLVPTF